MTKITRALVALVLLILIPITLVILVNSFDETLSPEAAKLLKFETPNLSEEEINAYQFSIGVACTAETDPLEYGKKIYSTIRQSIASGATPDNLQKCEKFKLDFSTGRCLDGYFCSANEFLEKKSSLEEYLRKNDIFFQRHQELIQKGIPPNPFPPSIRTEQEISVVALYRLHNLQTLYWLKLAHSGQLAEFASSLNLYLKFLRKNLDHQNSLLFNLVHTGLLKRSYDFYEQVLREYPALQAEADKYQNFNIAVLDFDSMTAKIMHFEIYVLADLLTFKKLKFSELFASASIGGENDNLSSKNNILNYFMPLLFLKNKTINSLYNHTQAILQAPCMREKEQCEETETNKSRFSIINPVGEKVVETLLTSVQRSYEKLHDHLQELNARSK